MMAGAAQTTGFGGQTFGSTGANAFGIANQTQQQIPSFGAATTGFGLGGNTGFQSNTASGTVNPPFQPITVSYTVSFN